MSGEYKRRGSFSASQMPVDGQGSDLTWKAGDWIVTDDKGVKRVYTDAQFKAQFVADGSENTQLAPSRPKKNKHGLAKRPPADPAFMQSIREQTSGKIHLNCPVDEDGNPIVDEDGQQATPMHIDRPPPRVKNVRLDGQGRPIDIELEVDDWPPKNERF